MLGSSARSARALGPCGAPWALVGSHGPLWAPWARVGRALGAPPGPLWALLGPCGPGPCGPPGPLWARPLWPLDAHICT